MRVISRSKKEIEKTLESEGIDYRDGMMMQENKYGFYFISEPAPEGESARYDAKTNTGGRRFVCWV